jgi:hypothetical protein
VQTFVHDGNLTIIVRRDVAADLYPVETEGTMPAASPTQADLEAESPSEPMLPEPTTRLP